MSVTCCCRSFFRGGGKILDVAGGPGIVGEWFKNKGYEVTLIDFVDNALGVAKGKGLNVIKSKIEEIEWGTLNKFDYVFLGDIIEHLFNVEGLIEGVKKVLKPGGKVIISCPNMAYWRFRMYYALDGDLERIDVIKAKPWNQEHIRFYNVRVLKELMGLYGFNFIKMRGSNNIWHSKWLAKKCPNLFAHTIVSEFKSGK